MVNVVPGRLESQVEEERLVAGEASCAEATRAEAGVACAALDSSGYHDRSACMCLSQGFCPGACNADCVCRPRQRQCSHPVCFNEAIANHTICHTK